MAEPCGAPSERDQFIRGFPGRCPGLSCLAPSAPLNTVLPRVLTVLPWVGDRQKVRALKGHHITAQSNALGFVEQCGLCPEGAPHGPVINPN